MTRGYHLFREIDTVTYDRRLIDLDTMVHALKKAGTYLGIAEKDGPP